MLVWKFQDFAITQILREIKFGDSRSAKSTILTHLEAIDFEFRTFSWLQFIKLAKFRASKGQNMTFLELLHSPDFT